MSRVVFGGLLPVATPRTGLSRGAQRAILGIGFGLPFPIVVAALAGLLPTSRPRRACCSHS